MKLNSRSAGFTLIELMITVAIVAILAAIALPSYRAYVLRANRVDGKSVLMKIQVEQEKAYLQYKRYATNAELTTAPTATTPGLNISATSPGGYYTIALAATADGGYSATATTTGSQQDDAHCASFTIDSSGTKTATNTDCWSK